MRRFTKEEVAKVLNKPGNYYFYDSRKRPLYVGWSAILKHRLQSYYQKDDFSEHPTKRELRPRIAYFSVHYRPLMKARNVELKVKAPFPFKIMKAGMKRK